MLLSERVRSHRAHGKQHNLSLDCLLIRGSKQLKNLRMSMLASSFTRHGRKFLKKVDDFLRSRLSSELVIRLLAGGSVVVLGCFSQDEFLFSCEGTFSFVSWVWEVYSVFSTKWWLVQYWKTIRPAFTRGSCPGRFDCGKAGQYSTFVIYDCSS